jgi:hypothetical protein
MAAAELDYGCGCECAVLLFGDGVVGYEGAAFEAGECDDEDQPLEIALKGLGAGAHEAKMISLHGATFQATNTITDPTAIHPVDGTLRFTGRR